MKTYLVTATRGEQFAWLTVDATDDDSAPFTATVAIMQQTDDIWGNGTLKLHNPEGKCLVHIVHGHEVA